MKNTTIFELSKILKLSPSTISRALKDHPDIAPETKTRVLELAKQLDYEPNLFAAGLRRSESREIGIIVPTLTGFFYDSFITAVEEEARQHKYTIVVMLSGDDPEMEQQNIRLCKQRRADGIMVCVTSRTTDVSYFEKIQKQQLPILFFDKTPGMTVANTVCVADVVAAQMAAAELINKNKSSVLSLFADTNFSITKKRLKAYQQAFHDAGKENHYTVQYALSSLEAERVVLDELSKKNYDAVFCMSDEILIGTMKALQRLDKLNQLGVIAISNGFFPTLYNPEVTYIETSGTKLGKLAFARMLELMKGDSSLKHLNVESILVRGGSL